MGYGVKLLLGLLLVEQVLSLQVREVHNCMVETLSLSCEDSKRKLRDGMDGWAIECIDRLHNQTFSMEYAFGHLLHMKCDGLMEYMEIFPACFSIGSIRLVELENCVPLSGYDAVFEKVHFQELRIVGAQGMSSEHLGLEYFPRLTSLDIEKVEMPATILAELPIRLQNLLLRDNQISELDGGWFQRLQNLTRLAVEHNPIKELKGSSFGNHLEELILSGNVIESIEPSVFTNMTKLKVLDLSDNRLKMLNRPIFSELTELVTLHLRSNNLESLSGQLLAHNRRLETLDLSYNPQLRRLPNQLLNPLPNLRKIDLKNCHLEALPEDIFSFNPKLQEVHLWNNQLTMLEADTFAQNKHLSLLDISFNHLEELPKDIFKNQIKLKSLMLTSNDLNDLPNGIFDNLFELRTIHLDRNRLKILNSSLFDGSVFLNEIDINSNDIVNISLGPLPFGRGTALRIVNLSSNKLQRLPEIKWSHYENLEQIDLNDNQLQVYEFPAFTSRHVEVHLRNNQIRILGVEASSMSTLPKTTIVNLDNNPLHCDCRMIWLQDQLLTSNVTRNYIFPNNQNLECRTPDKYSGQKIISLNPRDFLCPLQKGCPSSCLCYWVGTDGSVMVNCTQRNLEFLPEQVPQNVKILHLEYNRLYNLDDLNLKMWENLSEIYLDGNILETFYFWLLPSRVRLISLKNNNLRWLPMIVRNLTASLRDLQVYLSKNPWNCNCWTKDFRNWLLSNQKHILDLNDIRCKELTTYINGSLENVPVIEAPEEAVCPIVESSVRKTAVLTCVLIAIIVGTATIYYRHYLTINAFLYFNFYEIFKYIWRETRRGENKVYDAFVCHSGGKDADVVVELCNRMEPGYKLCLPSRDWLPKSASSWNVLNSIQNSHRSILILSENFLEYVWGETEMSTTLYQMLEDRKCQLIVVVNGTEPSPLPPKLHRLLSGRPRLRWGEARFWEKICFLMPRVKPPPSLEPTGNLLAKLRPFQPSSPLPPAPPKHSKVCTVIDFRQSSSKSNPVMLSRV